ncbi:Zn-dependent hydrolase [Aliiglaciecola sp. CAU 1673]|uniref:Zn-dependent hydrolase n=1 Tax=Aliiglaciecola sp. CAU 1673 TaxID=3032595 RepID=UPI0023DAD313|nr:Zn-dependent hydrolase [Aliiglaciecola sp. CAU 1673]MDF2179437.1 Zn-dependent hydrolase [Aliiglaciecola sp. CAU 1673]
MPQVHIELSRLQNDLLELAHIGYDPISKGINRPGFSEADMQARRWLMDKLEKEGFSAALDSAGNVIGSLYPDWDGPVVAMGSHIDSVPCGGMFDGTLGVLAGLECMRVARDLKLDLKFPFEIYAFAEEEGRFGGMMGVQAITGQLTPDWLEKAHDASHKLLKDEMEKCGLNAIDALNARVDPKHFHAFLELHIEQGPVLERIGKPIGVVEAISGVYKWLVRLIGKANHAGTAPMDMRSDAFMGLADFAHEIPRIISEEGTDKSRLTVGKVELKPGYAHTVPGEAEFTLVGRDTDPQIMRNLADACRKVLSSIARKHNLMFEFEQMSWLEPQAMSDQVVKAFCNQAKKLELEHVVMPSGAGHDAQYMAQVTPTGMIFVPSVGGVSHAPDEWTHWQDIEKGANLLLQTALHYAH